MYAQKIFKVDPYKALHLFPRCRPQGFENFFLILFNPSIARSEKEPKGAKLSLKKTGAQAKRNTSGQKGGTTV